MLHKLLAGGLLAVLMAGCTSHKPNAGRTAGDGVRVTTTHGPIVGTIDAGDAGVRIFRGIPYARPPVGDLRWRAPGPPVAWSEPRPATAFGTPCWQQIVTGFYSRGPIERSEDCLYLNVWTRAAAGERRPVMVWIHGGALEIGHGHLPMYDGARLTREGVVLVSINYRLGPLGYLAHPGLTAESNHGASGNQGVLDQIAALQWVQDNIAEFGGDPGNVTVFGESAGSWSVCYLVATPQARGLLHRAIGQSGGCLDDHPPLAAGEDDGAAFATAFGTQDLAALRALDAEQIYATTQSKPWRASGKRVYVDGHVFQDTMSNLIAAGSHNDVPILIGSNADEGTTLFMGMPPIDEAALRESMRQTWGEHREAALAAYAGDIRDDPVRARQQMLSDRLFAWQMRAWARAQSRHRAPAYLYFFTHAPDLGGEYGTSLGAYHAAEIPYAFGNIDLDRPVRPADRTVSDLMVRYWTNFAKTGNPNGPGLPQWPRYDAKTDEALQIAPVPVVIRSLRQEKLDVLDRMM